MGYKPSPRPSFDAPDRDPRGGRRAPHVGRRGGGLRRGLDLRLVAADPRDRLRPAARRRVPPLGQLPDGVRRRRAAPRPAGNARPREPGDRRGRARRAGRERLLPARHLASRLLVRRRAAARARVLRAAARDGHVGRVRADAAVSRGEPLCRRRRPRTRSQTRVRRARLVPRAAPRRRRLAARSRRARRAARQHRAPDGRHASPCPPGRRAWRRPTTARSSST